MIKSMFGVTQSPFISREFDLLPQQKKIAELIKIHAQHGGFSVIIGSPGVGKSILREHIQSYNKERDTVVIACSQTMHSYMTILKQLAESFKIDVAPKDREKQLIQSAYDHKSRY